LLEQAHKAAISWQGAVWRVALAPEPAWAYSLSGTIFGRVFFSFFYPYSLSQGCWVNDSELQA
jgi:hypothetical protein